MGHQTTAAEDPYAQVMNVGLSILLAVLAILPPLTTDEQGLLEVAYDGRDHQEPAFAGLLGNTLRWTGELGDTPVRLEPDLGVLLANPEEFRGDVCRIEGRLEKTEPLLPPYEGVTAWFVRVDSDVPVLVYVDFRPPGSPEQADFRSEARVMVHGRFYKRVDALLDGPGQDGQVHSYPAFVGAFPALVVSTGGSTSAAQFAAIIVPIIVVMGMIFFVLVLKVRGHREPVRPVVSPIDRSEYDGDPSLPDEPAEALQVLRKRVIDRMDPDADG